MCRWVARDCGEDGGAGVSNWDQEQTEDVIKGVVIAAAVMLLTKLTELAIDEFRRRCDSKQGESNDR